QCDFSDPRQFAKFGSAERYYLDSILRIPSDYPFDGSKKEVLEYHNSSSNIDRYVFEKWYPRFNGYAKFSPTGWGVNSGFSSYNLGDPATKEYIKIFGVMNTGSDGGRIGSNVYDTGSFRESNLKLDGNYGNAIEFWLNKGALVAASTEKEVVFDLWNGKTVSHAAGSEYGRFLVYLSIDGGASTPYTILTYVSGTENSVTNINIGNALCDNSWHHYAISVKNHNTTDVSVSYYIDGALSGSQVVANSAINEVTGALVGYIGAIQTAVDVAEAPASANGYGKLSGSIDEFRYWKKYRNAENIGRYWFTQVGGGSNNKDGNTSLGAYYKFNEGITQTSSIDSLVLDYSGRLSHGAWVGYGSDHRSTGSAIVESEAATFEFEDPTIYSFHPDVVDLITEKSLTGSYYDLNNSTCLYHSLPSWIIEEDEEREGYNARNLTQILSQYFDNLYLQISSSARIRDINYDGLSGSNKPYPFVNRLLESRGFTAPEIFIDASVLAQLSSRDEKREFEKNFADIRNLIYQNIYNNLTYLYKSKGTMNSIRNLIRCFGIDDELIKINLYANNSTFTFEDRFKSVAVKKKCIDFNNVDRFGGTIYQYTASSNAESFSYITSSAQNYEASGSSFTVESSFVFPKKFGENSDLYFETPFITSSLFGMHTVKPGTKSSYDTTWATSDVANFQVYALREEIDSKNVKFILTASSGGHIPLLTSSFYSNVYDNEKWTFAVKVRPEKYPLYDRVSGTADNNFVVEFYGVNTILDRVVNEFGVSSSISFIKGSEVLDNSKRLYVGSHYTNFTSSLSTKTDVRAYSSRVWMDYLEDEEIRSHAIDVENFGVLYPYENITLKKNAYLGKEIPKIESLALDWNFDLVTGSDSNGQFYIDDLSSGSSGIQSRYGWYSAITKKQHTGRGDFFLSNDSEVVDVEFLSSAKQKIPETIDHDGMIEILSRDDETFTRDTAPIDFFFAIEKSMYQTISEEMLNWFSTVMDFNNLVGMPVNRYRREYKDLSKLRQLFFERVGNTPDVEKYVDYYKWFDSSIAQMIRQLVPASANISDQVENVIESHILERSKYQTKFPTLEMKHEDPEGGLKGINELTYDWNHGHHPIGNSQKVNCLHWKQRELRSDTFLSSSVNGINLTKMLIHSASMSTFDRSLTTPHNLLVKAMRDVKGGANFNRNKKSPLFLKSMLEKKNTFFNILSSSLLLNDCNDYSDLGTKRKYNAKALYNGSGEYDEVDIQFPFNMLSASLKSGYNNKIQDLNIGNLHSDYYIDGGEVPLQGLFTEKHVGGNQYRHIAPNTGAIDTIFTRPEGFKLYRNSTTGDITIYGSNTSGSGEYTQNVPMAKRMRDEFAKRPINIRNIRGANFSKAYEYVQTSGRKTNNKAFVLSGGFGTTSSVPSTFVTGVVDYAKPSRGRHESVFVERFSAPGGPETSGDANGGVGLDSDAAEYSVYNSYNYRNLRVRDALKTLLTRYSGQFGSDSVYGSVFAGTYETSASFQKVNRNTYKTITGDSGSANLITS
ncbi:MAG: LamG-like jellyroll fold domain-containing protein, partial [Nanoarchaeota archaeon]|nr:LamG-like jellyroll fold domain-containing protein [Nanoarchaeota archaeon]